MNNHRLMFIVFLLLLLVAPNAMDHGAMAEINVCTRQISIIGNLVSHDIIWINGDEMFIEQAELEEWPGNGTQESPYMISGYYFSTWNKPLTIYHTTLHWVFSNNLIDGEDDHGGTWIQNCTNGAIVNNEFCNRRFGIAIAGGSGIKITGNYIHDCWENGIEFMAGMNNASVRNNIIENIGVAGFYSGLSHGSIVVNNTLTNCGEYGIALLGVVSHCILANNTISNCGNTTAEGMGVRAMSFNASEISANTITDCTSYGILIDSGNNSSIIWNVITNSAGYAVALYTASCHLLVKFNTFIDNGCDCQVLDNGTLNEFTHNRYSDWTAPDNNGDGYVDVPYPIEGSSNNRDLYPLADTGLNLSDSLHFLMEIIVVLVLMSGVLGIIGILYTRRNGACEQDIIIGKNDGPNEIE